MWAYFLLLPNSELNKYILKKIKVKALARTLGIKGSEEWHLLCKQKKRPKEEGEGTSSPYI